MKSGNTETVNSVSFIVNKSNVVYVYVEISTGDKVKENKIQTLRSDILQKCTFVFLLYFRIQRIIRA